MVTYEMLHQYLAKRPFEPFRERLTDGDVVNVVRQSQGVATVRQFIVSRDLRHFEWISLTRIAEIEMLPGAAA